MQNNEVDLREKESEIIDAAIKRFSHFGISKTSVTEIGNDLGISKQSFSYYFPDKNSLIHSVVKRILINYTTNLNKVFETPSIAEALSKMLILRRDFLKEYYLMLVADGRFDFPNFGNDLIKLKKEFDILHQQMLENVINKGIISKQVKHLDPAKTAKTLLQTFHAFDFCLKEVTPVPETQDFDDNLKAQQNALSIFLQGLNY